MNPSRTSRLIVPPAADVSPLDRESERMWGFADSAFEVRNEHIFLNSHRYSSGGKPLENFAPFVLKAVGVPFDANDRNVPCEVRVPQGVACDLLFSEMAEKLSAGQVSQDQALRLRHGHGHHLEEIYQVLYGELERVPDLVVYPASDEEVLIVLELAAKHNALIIPYGGGTCVSRALSCPIAERPIISLDLGRMNLVEWIDAESKTACIQAGAVGRILEAQLNDAGFTLGHEPDSMEFSTMGGWVATNASGMKKNRYGNIEEILLDVTIVTREGIVSHPCVVPRSSHGLDPRRLILGSEGLLGVITRCVVKIHALPEVRKYGSLVFPTWHGGLAFMEEISTWQAAPASVRLVDNLQFQFGRAMKPASKSAFGQALQKFFVTRVHGVDLTQMVACTLVYEGEKHEQASLEKRVQMTAKRYGGFSAGGAAGKDGYNLTFGIAYIRDFLLQYWTLGDSFETSVPWGKVDAVIDGVKAAVTKAHAELGMAGHPFVTARVSQIYQTGCCVYFYIGAHYKGVAEPLVAFEKLEHDARVAILNAGGSASHHHGIGKTRDQYLGQLKSPGALKWVQAARDALDPAGIFKSGNQGLSFNEHQKS